MAVKQIGKQTNFNVREYIGLSTDTKPTDCDPGSTFYEVNTGNSFIFDGTTWWPV